MCDKKVEPRPNQECPTCPRSSMSLCPSSQNCLDEGNSCRMFPLQSSAFQRIWYHLSLRNAVERIATGADDVCWGRHSCGRAGRHTRGHASDQGSHSACGRFPRDSLPPALRTPAEYPRVADQLRRWGWPQEGCAQNRHFESGNTNPLPTIVSSADGGLHCCSLDELVFLLVVLRDPFFGVDMQSF